jgi:allantoinase
VVTDHACCPSELKFDPVDKNNVWGGKSGFGGTEYLLTGLYSEGRKHGLSENRIAELLSFNPAQRFGLWSKGDIAPGLDGDLVIFDPDETWTIRAEDSPSAQGYTPFDGIEVSGKVKKTFLRGELIYDNGSFPGAPRGEYISRKIRK